jgi:hypothetical protein
MKVQRYGSLHPYENEFIPSLAAKNVGGKQKKILTEGHLD